MFACLFFFQQCLLVEDVRVLPSPVSHLQVLAITLTRERRRGFTSAMTETGGNDTQRPLPQLTILTGKRIDTCNACGVLRCYGNGNKANLLFVLLFLRVKPNTVRIMSGRPELLITDIRVDKVFPVQCGTRRRVQFSSPWGRGL